MADSGSNDGGEQVVHIHYVHHIHHYPGVGQFPGMGVPAGHGGYNTMIMTAPGFHAPEAPPTQEQPEE